jgi:hypothetical protein
MPYKAYQQKSGKKMENFAAKTYFLFFGPVFDNH